jgi:hypothetical protein
MASTAVVAAGVVGFAASSASASEQTTTTATFEWGLSSQMQSSTHIGPTTCHFFSVGPDRSSSSGNYTTTSGTVSVLKDGVAPTWANKCSGADTGTVNQKVVWTGGTGTVDPATGEATLSFTGKLWVNFYSGLSPFWLQNPVVHVDANGVGTVITATMGGFAADRDNPANPAVPIADVSNVTVADLTAVASDNGTGFVTTPVFAGVTITPPAGASVQNHSAAGWGSWPQSFIDFHGTTGLGSFWYTSGDSFDTKKSASAITLGYGTLSGGGGPEEPPAPEDGQQVISATVPQEVDPGEFVWLIDAADRDVTLTEASDKGTYLQSTGAIKPIKVTDGRVGGPTWSISGQVSDFSPNGLSGKYLGWTPNLSAAGSGAAPGSQVLPGITSGNGLKDTSVLALAPSNHAVGGTATLGADLDLRIPKDTAAGTYSASLTITALS